jgi:hypothetical protein
MDNIYVYHNNEQVGPFTEEKIRRYLDEGRIEPSTLGWVEGADDWRPVSEMLGLPVAQPVQTSQIAQPQPPQQQAAPQNTPSDPKKLILASWIMIGAICLVALIPGFGFLTWLIAFPVLLATLIMGILTLRKGSKLQGVSILLVSLIVAPAFLLLAPLVTTLGAVAVAGSSIDPSALEGNDAQDGDLESRLQGYWRPDMEKTLALAEKENPEMDSMTKLVMGKTVFEFQKDKMIIHPPKGMQTDASPSDYKVTAVDNAAKTLTLSIDGKEGKVRFDEEQMALDHGENGSMILTRMNKEEFENRVDAGPEIFQDFGK